MKKTIILLALIFLSLSFYCTAQEKKIDYKIANTFHLPGDGGWDYVAFDSSKSRLFISHGMITQVIDSKTGSFISSIEDTKGVHGIAIAYNENKAFISCGKDSSV